MQTLQFYAIHEVQLNISRAKEKKNPNKGQKIHLSLQLQYK
jgi:hypothetical protein